MFHRLYKSITRRDLLTLAGSTLVPVFAGTAAQAVGKSASDSDPLFFKPIKTPTWDTWMYHHRDTFYLYYLIGTQLKWNGVGMAVSRDGVHWQDRGRVITAAADVVWLGSGAVWSAEDKAGEKFIMNFSEWRGSQDEGRQTIFFAESRDLLHWTRLDSKYEFQQDTRWYEPKGRWDCIAPLPRPDGGYYGYWTANAKDGKLGLGFGESPDGVTWNALKPPTVSGVVFPPSQHATDSPLVEVGAVHAWHDKYYAIVGWDVMSVLVSDSPFGPFAPAARNRRLLVGNASYFCRFVDIPGEVLVNHQSWLPAETGFVDINTDFATDVRLAPLKRAVWDEEGTLRLMWWQGNQRAKNKRVRVELSEAASATNPTLLNTRSEQGQTLILEGVLTLPEPTNAVATGLYLQGSEETGTAFLVQENGAVDYGAIRSDGTQFQQKGHVDRELVLKSSVRFRLIRKGRMTEFYLNDVLMQCYCLPEQGAGHIGFLGSPKNFSELAAWYCQ